MKGAIWIERIVGVFLLVSAGLKALDLGAFELQIGYYGIIEDPGAIAAAARAVVGVEAILGALLLAGARLAGAVIAATLILLLGFSSLVVYGWAFQELDECGCFGAYVEMTPAVTLSKNVILMGALGFAGWSGRRARLAGNALAAGFAKPAAAAAGLALLAVAAAGFHDPHAGVGGAERPFAGVTYATEAGEEDLGEGTHFIAFYSATCEHCMAEAPELNDLVLDAPDMPAAAAFIYGEEDEIDIFEMITMPLFPLQSVEAPFFARHVGTAPPRYYLIHEGRPLESWEDSLPGWDAIEAALAGASE